MNKLETPDSASFAELTTEQIDSLPKNVREYLAATVAVSPDNPMSNVQLAQIFKGAPQIAKDLQESGVALVHNEHGKAVVMGAGFNTNGQLITTAAAVPRSPGKSEDFLKDVEDFSSSGNDRTALLDLYDRVYLREGVVNNAVNKAAALVATSGVFKVRYVKGKRGVSSDKRAEELRLMLQYWVENVNARSEDGPVTGARGVKAFMSQGVRLALKQGDHFGRQVWTDTYVPVLGNKYSLPMGLQTFDARTIEIPDGLEGTDIELFYWVPPSTLIDTLKNPGDPVIKEQLDRLIPKEVQSALITEGQYLLDPALMIHIKHRGTATTNFGESMIEPAMNEIAYKRALQALDIVTIENLINRLVIIMIGSDDPDSVYHKQEVSSSRMNMMSNMLRRVGPAATIIWPGPDLSVKEIGAHDEILDTNERYVQAENRIRSALGVPSALLTGDTSSGKAAGWAAILGLAAELSELQDQYAQVFKTIAERVALENGYEDVDVTWEFNQALLANKEEHANMVINTAKLGGLSFQTILEELGFDFESELVRMQDDVDNDRRDELFGPPRALGTPGAAQQDGGAGRPTDTTETDPRNNTETQTPNENV